MFLSIFQFEYYEPQALTEVEQFVIQQHQQQMIQSLKERRPDATQEQLRSFVRKCVRRQVQITA